MLKLGEKIISDIYLGDKKIAKVFLGDKLVYQAGKPIFLDYVRFDGASYIDTGIKHQTCTVECDLRFDVTGARQLMGFGASTAQYWGAGATGTFDYVNNTDATVKNNLVIQFNTDNPSAPTKTMFLNGKQIGGVSTGSSISSYTYTIGAVGTNIKAYFMTGEVWGNKFTNADGELIQDLRPCIDPNGTVCFYDMVTKKYFYNKGTGTLTAGNVIKFVDYIIFDGNSWIDTGLYGSNNTKIEATYQPTAFENGFYGSYSSGKNFTAYISKSGAWRFGNGAVYHTHTSSIVCDSIQNKDGATVNGKTLAYSAQSDFVTASTLTVGKVNGGTFTNFKGNIYSFKIYESDVLVQDLRPCIVAGEAGFYDMVTGKVFTNAGTGTLKANGRFVKSILFDGASYINTGVLYQTCTVKTETKFSLTGTRQLMGFSGSSPIHYWGCNTSGYLDPLTSVSGLEFKEIEIAYNKDNADNKTLTITADGKSAVKTGKMDASNFYLIGCIEYGSYSAQCEVKYNEIYVNSELIQDLRPYVDENGTACFKDVVTGKLFYNQGTGTLGYTEE